MLSYTGSTHWDSHATIDLATKWTEINTAVSAFVTEMKHTGLWNNVTLVLVSDFGRTLTWNGRGTDHGWGGHYFAREIVTLLCHFWIKDRW